MASTTVTIPNAAYVHVPFCVHRCGYCDFTVISNRDDLMPQFLAALGRELETTLNAPHPVESLFIGGGTPTYLPPNELREFFELLHRWLPATPTAEVSVEANPRGLDDARIAVLTDAGVTRVSLGVQSFDNRDLHALERDHTGAMVADVVARLRRHGIENISLDLIYGVPGQSIDVWTGNLEAAIALRPEHISTYGLTFEKGTAFWSRRNRGQLKPVDEELERTMYAAAMDRLSRHGYEQYELSNFARPEFRCRHNQVYWRADPYFAFGPGAASYIDGVRRTNHRSTTTWIRKVLAGECGVADAEPIDEELRAREAVMLGLRMTEGIDLKAFEQRFGWPVESLAGSAWHRLLDTGLLEIIANRVRLTFEGRFVADSVIVEFL